MTIWQNGVDTKNLLSEYRLSKYYGLNSGSCDVSGGAVQRGYVTPFLDENLSLTESGGESYYYSHDGLGSVRSITDASGSLTSKYDYTAFGRMYEPGCWSDPAAGLTQRFGFTGREAMPLLGDSLLNYRNRSYAPGLGRFMSPDPIGYKGGVNLYNYAGSDPS